MSRARRLAGLPPPKDDLIIESINKSSSISSKLTQPIKKVIVPKNIRPSRKSSRIESRISLKSKMSPLIKKEDVTRSRKAVNFDDKVEEASKSKSYERDNNNSLNVDNINKEPEVASRKPIFQVPIKPVSKLISNNSFS
jgi:hypothetical protein